MYLQMIRIRFGRHFKNHMIGSIWFLNMVLVYLWFGGFDVQNLTSLTMEISTIETCSILYRLDFCLSHLQIM